MVVAGCRQEEQDWGHHQVRVLGIEGLLNDWETAQQTTAGALHRTAVAGTAELSGAGGAVPEGRDVLVLRTHSSVPAFPGRGEPD